MRKTVQLVWIAALVVGLAAGAAYAQVATMSYGSTSLSWNPIVDNEGITLNVAGNGRVYTQSFAKGETPNFSIFSGGDALPDGLYKWELRPMMSRAMIESGTFREGQTNRDGSVSRDSSSPRVEIQSGTFRVVNGTILDRTLAEADAGPGGGGDEGSFSGGGEGGPRARGNLGPVTADFVINDDLIVDGSACIGFDCVNGEVFSFDTIRLKENNLRIKADDTSVAASFPRNDWQLVFNESANGGASKFSVEDVSGGRTPFTIEANARSHSLYVDDGGRIGSRTSTPSTEIHTIDGDTPTLRLQQDGSSGFEPQTWDVAGNETNFFIRDVTNGSALPFRIRPAAPSNSIFVDVDGDVSLGNSSPDAKLHVDGDSLVEDAGINVGIFRTTGAGAVTLQMEAENGDDIWQFGVRANDTFIITPSGTIGAPVFFIDTSGNVTIPGGALYNGSDRNTKREIVPVDGAEVLERLEELPISSWNRKTEDASVRHMGPMAQDFAATFGLGKDDVSIASLDMAGVALAAVQGLNSKLERQVVDLESEKADLLDRVERLEELVERLADER